MSRRRGWIVSARRGSRRATAATGRMAATASAAMSPGPARKHGRGGSVEQISVIRTRPLAECAALLDPTNPHDAPAEGVRFTLRTRINHMQACSRIPTVVVRVVAGRGEVVHGDESRHGTGPTRGNAVLLCDFDFRRPIRAQPAVADGAGRWITDYLLGRVPLQDAIRL